MAKKYLALVGGNVGKKRFEAGDVLEESVFTEKQLALFVKEAYVIEVDDAKKKEKTGGSARE